MSTAATEFLDAADKHVPTLGLNARRKFFHGLAVIMFIPGIAVDPAFTHLSFSVAFSLFIFAEYVRYFAIYPFGASVHIFMNEFLDHKDSGTAILSHFYLLTGCAGSVWLEGHSKILQFTGTLCLGIGDAVASIVGRRIGKHRWSPSTSKTIEGSLAFVLSVVSCAWVIRLLGYAEPFSTVRYTIVISASALLEALSDQNDNLTLPLYMWIYRMYLRHPFSIQLGPFAPSLERPHITVSPQPRRLRKSSRPSTAPAHEDAILLPSATIFQTTGTRSMSLHEPALQHAKGLRPVIEDEIDASGGFNLASLPSVFDIYPETLLSGSIGDPKAITNESCCDWATFISAYAAGRWDPHKTPNPPLSCQRSSETFKYPSSEPLSGAMAVSSDGCLTERSVLQISHSESDSMLDSTIHQDVEETSQRYGNDLYVNNGRSLTVASTKNTHAATGASLKYHGSRSSIPLHLSLPAHRLRNSFSNSLSMSSNETASGTPASNAEVQATVATMRWAAARVDISPLALPSPEHELTDPMRGVTATIPGSHPPEVSIHHDFVTTPGGTRRTRLASFWQGTTDVERTENLASSRLTPIAGSPAFSPENESSDVTAVQSQTKQPSALVISDPSTRLAIFADVPPATAPALKAYDEYAPSEMDYFGDVHNPVAITSFKPLADSNGSSDKHSEEVSSIRELSARHSSPLDDLGSVSVPALPRRVNLTRQTSSPLPVATQHGIRFNGGRAISENIVSAKATRAVKEEQMFQDLGYLVPPNPPNELERRRALYKFNIWNTGPDSNFDRIAHLAKLVFNAKGVLIALIDGSEQWRKSEWGLKIPSSARVHSLCGHAILQADEPMVILDTHLDWRFARNPLIVDTPHVRFYAGAPLRTQDGYNIGTYVIDYLMFGQYRQPTNQPTVQQTAVIDDTPREEFAPRQRHTLKEFAVSFIRLRSENRLFDESLDVQAIAMREMELWRDKIQLRIRDRIQTSMEQFSRECLEIDTDIHSRERPELLSGSSMDRIYDHAAKLVKRTLDVEGVIVMDVSHCEVLESMSAEGSVSVTMHYGDPQMSMSERQLTTEEYRQLNDFFSKHPEGKISEGIIPATFRSFLPTHIQYALTVPIYNVDKRPFALLCAYNANGHSKRFLEGHELSYLRAIGVIILSAVLKRRMMLADKAKSLFISNISHELRTPLHGILAAAELLGGSPLNHSQLSFLQTVQACGTSLVETVNHVLDFTKLSGNAKAGGVENGGFNATSGGSCSWLLDRSPSANSVAGDSGIGSVYSPPKEERVVPANSRLKHVETVVDIGYRAEGWTFKCERGGVRRVLMNLFGNSLKFTSEGYIHVILRQIPSGDDEHTDKIKIELSVNDTGKGISQNFLKNQLFHPFSQENPLQTGTGLGLAIVSSIVTSESVGGKVDVWSEEGSGTEIKVTFSAEPENLTSNRTFKMEPFKADPGYELPSISLVGFDTVHRGIQLLEQTLRNYLVNWWGLKISYGSQLGEIIILNDDTAPIVAATKRRDNSRSFVILSAARESPSDNVTVMTIVDDYKRIGGFCNILYKPAGPSRLRAILRECLDSLKIARSQGSDGGLSTEHLATGHTGVSIARRNSEENYNRSLSYRMRPSIMPRSSTADHLPMARTLPITFETTEIGKGMDKDIMLPTIAVGPGGTLLKSSVGALDTSQRRFRVLVVEDNNILRNLLIKWLSGKGYDFKDAVDGRDGVDIYSKDGPFDVVLIDLSMPVLDGVAATSEIRRIEAARRESLDHFQPTRILALTGMSSLEDKRRAFEAGVDGYLVKPVAFKTLDEMFHKLGIS
ncbi:hypothetical protein BDQ17DRAFT_1426959 [Cyathus striatus]|nr:hypothetical protein BDQ17DRAFT_1426959 [Cyathus striatus]